MWKCRNVLLLDNYGGVDRAGPSGGSRGRDPHPSPPPRPPTTGRSPRPRRGGAWAGQVVVVGRGVGRGVPSDVSPPPPSSPSSASSSPSLGVPADRLGASTASGGPLMGAGGQGATGARADSSGDDSGERDATEARTNSADVAASGGSVGAPTASLGPPVGAPGLGPFCGRHCPGVRASA